jgi:hypothetical protein
MSRGSGPQDARGFRNWLRSVGFTLLLALLVAAAVGDAGRVLPFVVIGVAALGMSFLYWLFPRGLHFAVGTATGLVLYTSLYVVLGQAQFPHAPDWSRPVGYLMPVIAFLALAWWRRQELSEVVDRQAATELDVLPHTARWLFFTAMVGLVCFVMPVNRLVPAAQGAALLVSMAAISGIVALAARDVVRLLVDVALIMHEIGGRARHLMVPATAFTLMYALLVVGFAAAYRIADALSLHALFQGPDGPIRVSYSDALHFSVVTISTVGYGDIRPEDDGIRVLASLQVLAGQLLLLFGFAEIMRARRGRNAAPADHERHPRPPPD